MENSPDLLPGDVAALRAELIAARAKGAQIEAELAVATASEDLRLGILSSLKPRGQVPDRHSRKSI